MDLQAGTLEASPSGSCYWARYDASGEVLDNNFTDATRVVVDIKPTDYSFSSEGCGGWTQTYVADPDLPKNDRTSCGVYRLALEPDERVELVGPFLLKLRAKQGILENPSDALIRKFSQRVFEVCGQWEDDEDDDEESAGAAASVVYEVYNKEFRK